MCQRGPQFGGLRIPDPRDQADGVENSGGLLEQRSRLTWLIKSSELRTQLRGRQEIWLGCCRRFQRSAVGGCHVLNGGSAALDYPPPTGKKDNGRADKIPEPGRRPHAHPCPISACRTRGPPPHPLNRDR